MAQSQKGLGRGLEILLGGFGDAGGGDQDVRTLPLDAIRANQEQPRRVFDPRALEDLAASIREQGLLQPVLVRPVAAVGGVTHEIVAGERRWRAARLAGLSEIPVLVREVDEERGLALALVENLQREDLSPMEEAAGYQMLQTRFGMTQEELARKVGKSRSAVANALRLLQLPEAVRADLESGRLTAGHARALLAVADEALREELWWRIVEGGLSVRQAEDAANHVKTHGCLPQADTPAGQTPKPGRRTSRTPVDGHLRDIGGQLVERVGVMVKTSGTPDHGRITFAFSSRRELQGLLEHFGLERSLASGDGA